MAAVIQLRKIEGSTVLWTCEIKGNQQRKKKKKDFLLTQEPKWGTRAQPTLLHHSPVIFEEG